MRGRASGNSPPLLEQPERNPCELDESDDGKRGAESFGDQA
jgi:hypothetical protein